MGYLQGTSHPRADSLENLAERLGIPLVELICDDTDHVSKLDPDYRQLFSDVSQLHPMVQSVAQQTISFLKTIFQISEELYNAEKPAPGILHQNQVYRYCLHEMRDPFRHTTCYGILVKEQIDETWIITAHVAPFSNDRAAVLGLIDRCTKLQLSPEHISDVVQDFLTQQSLNT